MGLATLLKASGSVAWFEALKRGSKPVLGGDMLGGGLPRGSDLWDVTCWDARQWGGDMLGGDTAGLGNTFEGFGLRWVACHEAAKTGGAKPVARFCGLVRGGGRVTPTDQWQAWPPRYWIGRRGPGF